MNKGQAALTLIFFALVAMIATSAAVIAIVSNNLTQTKMEQGISAYYAAEAGKENALLRLLRQPNYLGETLTIDQTTTVEITVEPLPTPLHYRINALGQSGEISRQIQTIVDYNDNVLEVISCEEIK